MIKIVNSYTPFAIKLLLCALFFITAACGDKSGPAPTAENPPAEPTELTVEQKIKVTQQCFPNYQTQTVRSTDYFERIKATCLPNLEDQAEAELLIQSLREKLGTFQPNTLTPENYSTQEPLFKDIIQDYQKLQNKLAYCRTQRILEGQSPAPDDSLFLHAIGDIFGKESGLEGNQQANTIPYRTKLFEQIQKQLEGFTFIADEIQSRPCNEPRFKILPQGKSPRPDISQELLQKLIQQSKNAEDLMKVFKQGDLTQTRQLLVQQLGQLGTGESLFLPAGWTKHAVLYQFTKQPNGQVSFRIFNSGEGINTYHAESRTGYKTQYFPFVEITDIAQDRITSFVFLKSLQEIATPGVYASTPQDFYERLLTALDGQAGQVKYDTSLFKDPQQAGTCTYFPTAWLLSSTVDPDVADQIESFVSLKTLKSFASQTREWNEAQLSLLRKGLVFVSESAARGYQSDVIDAGTLHSVADLGANITETIQKADRALEKRYAQNAANFRTEDLKPSSLPTLTQELNAAAEIRAGSAGREAKSPVFDLNQELPRLYELFKNTVLPSNYYSTPTYNKEHSAAVVFAIEQLALKLPLTTSFWAHRDPYKNMEALSKISELYLFILLKQVQDKQRDPDRIPAVSYLAALKFLTVADLINQRFVNNIHPKIPSMYQPRAGLILSGTTSIFETSDPRWQEQMKLMQDYYASEKDQTESFFGFEKYPSGTQAEYRLFYDDPQAAEILTESHWSIDYQYQWPDLKWAKKYIAENHINTGNANYPGPAIVPFKYECSDTYSCEPNGFQKSYGPFHEESRATSEILLNRTAMNALANNTLPATFRELRTLSVVSDFLLSGRFANDSQELVFMDGVKTSLSTLKAEMSKRSTARYSCSCNDYHYRSQYDSRGNYVGQERIPPFKKQENAKESTTFNGYGFSYKLFGQKQSSFYYSDTTVFKTEGRQPIQIGVKGSHVSPWLNLRDSALPFVKFESTQGLIQKCSTEALNTIELRQNCKVVHQYHYTELLQIWSLGQNRALELLDPAISPLRYRVEPNAYILKKPTDLTASGDSFDRLSLERMRNLMGINAVPELQLKATLDFFTKYPELYILPEYQVLFEKLMMEPALMQDQLRISDHDSELFISSLADFCDSKLKLFKKYYDYKSIAFTLHMKQLFYIQALFAQVPEKIMQRLLGAPEDLFAIIQELKPEQLIERSFLNRNLAEMFLYSPALTKRDAELLLFASIEFKAIPQKDLDYQDRFAESSIRDILVRQHENLKSVINDGILDFVVSQIRPNVQRTSSSWKSRDAIYTANFGSSEFQIDILNGQLYDAGNPRVLFPIDVAEFKKVFGESAEAPSHAILIGIDTYEWDNAKAQKNGIGWIFQKRIDNTWYQYLDESDLNKLGDARLKLKDHLYWRSIGTQPTTLKVYSSEEKLAYEVKLSGNSIQSFKRLKDNATLIDTTPASSYRVFAQIELWKHVYLWQDPNTKQVIEIELPRLDLSFKAQKDHIQCADHSGYKIAEKQYATELGNPVNYLVCDSTQTTQKILLMPPNQLEPTKGPLGYKPTLAPEFETLFDSDHVLVYETSPEFGLSKTTEESRYYLALRSLFKREYRQAAEEIRNTSIELKPLETNEQKVITWLIAGNVIDSDPRSYAVRLLAAYWNSKHEQYYLGIFKPVPQKLYDAYLEKVGRVDTSILGLFEEEKIAQSLGVTQRLEQLKADAENRPYNPSPLSVNTLSTPPLTRAANSLALDNFEKLFKTPYQKPNLNQQPALKPKEIFTDDTFSLLYSIAAGESFNRSQALSLLELVIGIRANLTDSQIREEFITLMHLASLDGSSNARFLESVVKTKKDNKELLTLSQTVSKINALEHARTQEQQAQRVYSAASSKQNARWDDYQHLARHYWNLQKARENLEANFRSYFEAIKSNDLATHHTVKTNIESGPNKAFPGVKTPIIPEASADISTADLPLAQVALEDPLKEPILSPNELAQVVRSEELSLDQKNKILSDAKSLQNSLNRSDNKSVQKLKEKILTEAISVQEKKRFYKDVQWRRFKAPDVSQKEREQTKLKKDILELGQRYAPALEGGAFNRVLHLADTGKQINLNDLIYVLMKRSLVSLYNTQGALKLEDLNTLYQNLVRYLMISTYLEHVRRFEGAANTAHAACRNINTDDCQIKLGNAVLLAESVRNYSIASHIEYLVFEYFMKILIRLEQVKALDQLQIKDGQIHNERALGGLLEMIMGAGKTSVLLPLISVLDNSRKFLNMIVLPEALITSMSVDLSKQLSSSFSRAVMVMNISRQRYLYQADLNLLYERLVKAREQNQTVITTNSAIQSLFLSFVDRLSRYESEPNQVSGEIEQFQKIFRLLRDHGKLTIDEVDLALDILQAHQFSVGAPQPLVNSPTLKTIPVVAFSLYQAIATQSSLYKALDFPFLHVRGQQAFTAGSYAAFKPKLIDAILKPQFLSVSEDLNRIYNSLVQNTELKDLARSYLLSNKTSVRNSFFAQIKDSKLKDIFAVLYDEVNHVLPLTAVRKVGVHYGPLVAPERKSTESQENFDRRMLTYKNAKLIAIPYHSGEPMVNSRFGTPLESLNYTLQLALHQKGYRDSIEQEIKSLKKMIFENSPNLTNGTFQKRLEALSGPGVKLNVMQITPHDIDRINARIQSSQHIKEQLELDWLYVIPQVRFSDKQLMTNAQIYQSLFKYIQGFSGTLWSAETFPKVFQDPTLSDTAPKTFLTVWRDYLEHKKPLLALKDTPSYLEQIYSGRFTGSLMDEAGIFRGSSNEKIAQEIKHQTGKQVAFYDDKNNLIIPETKNFVAFWDKKHTTGSDIKLDPNMEATMTVDFHITSRSFQQTAWRLRGLGNGQKVVTYASLEDDLNIMRDRLKNEFQVTPELQFGLGDLILYSILNEDTKLDELKFRALKQKMKNIVIGQVLDKIFQPGASAHTMYAAYKPAQDLFEKTPREDLYLTMGIPVKTQLVEKAISAEKERIKDASYLAGLNSNDILGKITELVTKELPSLPPKVKYSDREDGNEVEIETETETETQTERDEKIEDFSALRDHIPHAVLPWIDFEHIQPIPIGHFDYSNEVSGNPVVNLKQALKVDKLQALSAGISDNFLVSLNFAPLHHQHRLMKSEKTPYEFEFFGPYHKNLQDVLLIQNKTTGVFTFVLIDENDAKQWDIYLRSHPARTSQNRYALYNLSTHRIYREGQDPIREESIPKHLLVEASFLAGRVNYPKDQQDDLKAFLEHAGPKAMLQVFNAEILRYHKPDTQKAFRGSDLERIFIELLGSVD